MFLRIIAHDFDTDGFGPFPDILGPLTVQGVIGPEDEIVEEPNQAIVSNRLLHALAGRHGPPSRGGVVTEKGRVIEATPILAFTIGWSYYRLAVLA